MKKMAMIKTTIITTMMVLWWTGGIFHCCYSRYFPFRDVLCCHPQYCHCRCRLSFGRRGGERWWGWSRFLLLLLDLPTKVIIKNSLYCWLELWQSKCWLIVIVMTTKTIRILLAKKMEERKMTMAKRKTIVHSHVNVECAELENSWFSFLLRQHCFVDGRDFFASLRDGTDSWYVTSNKQTNRGDKKLWKKTQKLLLFLWLFLLVVVVTVMH